jgi:hypothetical protein
MIGAGQPSPGPGSYLTYIPSTHDSFKIHKDTLTRPGGATHADWRGGEYNNHKPTPNTPPPTDSTSQPVSHLLHITPVFLRGVAPTSTAIVMAKSRKAGKKWCAFFHSQIWPTQVHVLVGASPRGRQMLPMANQCRVPSDQTNAKTTPGAHTCRVKGIGHACEML